MRKAGILLVLLPLVEATYAAVCNPADLQGAYGFQLDGVTTIGSHPEPAVTVGRLVFDGAGNIAGVSSVSFTGLYLGHSVKGMYRANIDCSVSWSVQDDSGGDQHFEGSMTPNARRVQFHQSDSGGPSKGVLVKSGDTCQDGDFQPRYRFSLSGKQIDVDTARVAGSVSASGVLENRNGQLTLTLAAASAPTGSGSLELGDGCFVTLHLTLPGESSRLLQMNFRGILVDGGRELLGMATDAGTAVSLRLSAP